MLPHLVEQAPEAGVLGSEVTMERPRRHRQLGSHGFHGPPARGPEAEEMLANAFRDARASAPPAEQLAALRLAEPRGALVRLRQRLVSPLGIDDDAVLGLAEE